MAAKKSFPMVVVGPGVAAFVHVAEPDNDGKFANNKYKLTLKVEKSKEGDATIKQAQAAAKEAAKIKWGSKLPANLAISIRDGDTMTNAEGKAKDDMAGFHVMTPTSKFEPGVFNAAKEQLDPNTLKPGDTVKVCMTTYPYEQRKKVEREDADGNIEEVERISYGVSFQLRSIQVLAKGSGGAGSADDFDDETGEYDAVQSQAAKAKADDEAPGSGGADDF